MELNDYIHIIAKKWYIVLVVTILSVALSAVYSVFFAVPTYKATVPVIIGSIQQKVDPATGTNLQTYSDLMMYQKLVETYCQFVKTRIVVEDAIKNSGIKVDYDKAIKMISAAAKEDTEFMEISVVSPNKYEAALFANSLAESLKSITFKIKNIDNVQLVDEAAVPEYPMNKSLVTYLFVSFIFGIGLSIGIILLTHMLDNTVKDADAVQKSLGVSAIGSIPFEPHLNKEKNNDMYNIQDDIVTYHKPTSLTSESYKTLRTNLQFSLIDKKMCAISITSCMPGEGKSTVISNLAVTLAQSGKKVILVDCDLRKPSIHKKFELPNNSGLTNILLGEKELSSLIQKTPVDNLYILTSGTIPPNPSEILSSQKYLDLINSLKMQYDFVFIDAPPVLVVTDAQIIAGNIDGVLLVAQYGAAEKAALLKAKESLDIVDAKCLGVVINQIPKKEIGYYGYGKKYGGKYGYKYKNSYYTSD
ncbi:MAG: polysaccharide biosynthesis tyrosine autokinase [Clostridia bacterium]|nr:polysaccharide biosynthesis tyrosine autokinase [Clostridia bacterium]